MFEFLSYLLDSGGTVVALLLMLSVIALAMMLMKMVQFFYFSIIIKSVSRKALGYWHQQQNSEAINCLESSRHPFDRLLLTACLGQRQKMDGDLLREELVRLSGKLLNSLGSLLRPLEIIASISPLMGLLGTVLGMVEAFKQLEMAGSQVDPSILSGGIWQALLTTAIGLSIAIPVTIAHGYFDSHLSRLQLTLEDMITQVFTGDVIMSTQQAQSLPDSMTLTVDHAA